MFERYTEKARRAIFFSRYVASKFGASQIEAEHILLGLIHEDKNHLARVFQGLHADFESIRKEIEGRTVARDRVSLQIDLPLSGEAKRAPAFAAEESETLSDRQIGTEHLLLGLLRQENSTAAKILDERGLRLSDIRQNLMRQTNMRQRLADETAMAPPDEVTISRPGTQKLSLDVTQPTDRDERWMRRLAETCLDAGLFMQEELASEFERVAALRRF